MSNMENTILISTIVVGSLPLVPVSHFLSFGWEARRQQILSRFSDEIVAQYRMVFAPEGDFSTSRDFARRYDFRYGRHLFLRPVMLYFAAVIFLSYLSVSWALGHGWSPDPQAIPQIIIFSLAGAYLWVVNDTIVRARQNDMVTSDINRATLRLFLAIPLGLAVSAPFSAMLSGPASTTGAAALAFFVGAFPTETILKFMRRSASKYLFFDADASGANVEQLKLIDGINVTIAERLIDEGVNTVVQLAYSDPVSLTIKSGMDFSFILDCTGQALAAVYFTKEQLPTVRRYGLRGGIEVKTLSDELASYDEARDAAALAGKPEPTATIRQKAAQAQLIALAAELKLDPAALQFILNQIAEDPYTLFAYNIWGPEPKQSVQ